MLGMNRLKMMLSDLISLIIPKNEDFETHPWSTILGVFSVVVATLCLYAYLS